MSFYLVIFATILSALFGYLRYKYSYWKLKGMKQLEPHFLFGNFSKIRTMHNSELYQEVYDDFKGKTMLAGSYVFVKPIAVILDLDLIKAILVKDFNNFVDRSDFQNEEKDRLSAHLFQLCGEKWRSLRSKLSPTFTSGKMKFMFPTIVNVAKEFKDVISAHLQKTPDEDIEVYDFMGRYTTDVIGTCIFGIECNSLKDPNVAFRRIGKRIFSTGSQPIRWALFIRTYSKIAKLLGAKRIAKDVEKFIIDVVKETVSTREEFNIRRNDFINVLIELKNSKDANGQSMLSIYQLAAQVFLFFAAGFETSSSNLTFGLYELAKNPCIQEKVRAEILAVLEKHNGQLSYEAMMEMQYLDKVISETLRKYPALAGLTRIVGEDYRIPGTDFILEKNTEVVIPVKAIHYDPTIYEEPYEFRPERFSPEEIQKRHSQSFLGFGDGPRNCIGLRFARMQVRVGLITLLRSFRFSVSAKTPEKIKMSERSFVLIPGCNVWLKVEHL